MTKPSFSDNHHLTAKCLADDDYRGTIKVVDRYHSGEWDKAEYRLIRMDANMDLGWSPVLIYSATIKAENMGVSICLQAISGTMSDGNTGHIIQAAIYTPQIIPATLWAITQPKLGNIIELPPLFEHLAECEIDLEEPSSVWITNKTKINGHFGLEMPPPGTPIHEPRPIPECIKNDREYREKFDHVRAIRIFDRISQ